MVFAGITMLVIVMRHLESALFASPGQQPFAGIRTSKAEEAQLLQRARQRVKGVDGPSASETVAKAASKQPAHVMNLATLLAVSPAPAASAERGQVNRRVEVTARAEADNRRQVAQVKAAAIANTKAEAMARQGAVAHAKARVDITTRAIARAKAAADAEAEGVAAGKERQRVRLDAARQAKAAKKAARTANKSLLMAARSGDAYAEALAAGKARQIARLTAAKMAKAVKAKARKKAKASGGIGHGHGGVKPTQKGQGQFGRVMVVMGDNRKVAPTDGAGIDEYWSLAYELNRRWACRHGYDFVYYRFKDYYRLPHPTMSITGVTNPIAACKQDVPYTPTMERGGDGGKRLWREAAYCKLAAFGDALVTQDYDTVVWMDSDLFMEQPEVDLDELVRRFAPVKCQRFHRGECVPGGDAADAEFWFAQNWPWDKAMPNSGFFIARNKGLVHELLAAWWNVRETAHNGIFEQHSLWSLIQDGHYFAKHIALMPLKAMTPDAKGKSPLRHLESSQRKNRTPVLRAAVQALSPLTAQCGQVIEDFDATRVAHNLFPMRTYDQETSLFVKRPARK